MIEVRASYNDNGQPVAWDFKVKGPEGTTPEGLTYHLFSPEVFRQSPWLAPLLDWWGWLRLPGEEGRTALRSHPDLRCYAEPTDWKLMDAEGGGQELGCDGGYWVAFAGERRCRVERRP